MSKLTTGTYEKYNAKYSTLTLTDGEYALTVTPEKGGMATSFTKSGEEYLWLRDKNYESSDRPRCGVPILFPSCGKPDGGVHHFNGSDYPIEVHGFADLLPWQVKTAADDEIVLTLTPNGLTKFVYPFDFLLEMRYTLSGAKAGLELTVHNTSDKALPFSIDSWAGRLRSCRGLGASLPPERVAAFERQLRTRLAGEAGERFTVLHYVEIELHRLNGVRGL